MRAEIYDQGAQRARTVSNLAAMGAANRLMLLLGAGASVDAGIPDTKGLTRALLEKFRSERVLRPYAPIMSFVVGGLLFQRGMRNQDPFGEVDVETLFNAFALLSDRHSSEAAPFVGSWHAMVEELDQVPGGPGRVSQLRAAIYGDVVKGLMESIQSHGQYMRGSIDDAIREVIREEVRKRFDSPTSYVPSIGFAEEKVSQAVRAYIYSLLSGMPARVLGSGISIFSGSQVFPRTPDYMTDEPFARALEQAVETMKPQSGQGQAFRTIATKLLQVLEDFVWISDKRRVRYLRALFETNSDRDLPVIATLNYDNSVELAADAAKHPVTTGISEWPRKVFESTSRGQLLLKLHGSIDWEFAGEPAESRAPLPRRTLRVREMNANRRPGDPAIRFGIDKLTAEGPFLDLLRAFSKQLARASRLVVVGYSFRDVHVNTIIADWINLRTANNIIIVDPGFVSNENPFPRLLRQHCSDRLTVIGRSAKAGLRRGLEAAWEA